MQYIGMQNQITNKIHYDANERSLYILYVDANNLYGWAMIQKLLLDGFKWIKKVSRIDEDFIKNYDKDSDNGYILEVDIEYSKELHELHNDLLFLPERMKIN